MSSVSKTIQLAKKMEKSMEPSQILFKILCSKKNELRLNRWLDQSRVGGNVTRYKMSYLFSLVKTPVCISLIFILFHSEVNALEKPPFLFGKDEALSDSGEFFDKIEKSHEIEKDEFLQYPLTKLD